MFAPADRTKGRVFPGRPSGTASARKRCRWQSVPQGQARSSPGRKTAESAVVKWHAHQGMALCSWFPFFGILRGIVGSCVLLQGPSPAIYRSPGSAAVLTLHAPQFPALPSNPVCGFPGGAPFAARTGNADPIIRNGITSLPQHAPGRFRPTPTLTASTNARRSK